MLYSAAQSLHRHANPKCFCYSILSTGGRFCLFHKLLSYSFPPLPLMCSWNIQQVAKPWSDMCRGQFMLHDWDPVILPGPVIDEQSELPRIMFADLAKHFEGNALYTIVFCIGTSRYLYHRFHRHQKQIESEEAKVYSSCVWHTWTFLRLHLLLHLSKAHTQCAN